MSIDVTNEYSWTLSKNRSEVPSVMMKEYEINTGWLMTALLYYTSQPAGQGLVASIGAGALTSALASGVNSVSNRRGSRILIPPQIGGAVGGALAVNSIFTQNDFPYKSLYRATPTGNDYIFPYLSSDKFSRMNSFQEFTKTFETLSNLAQRIAPVSDHDASNTQIAHMGILGIQSAMAGITSLVDLLGKGTTDILAPQKYTSTTENDYSFSFDLSNTIGDENEIIKNRELANTLVKANSPFKRNFAITDPVSIYEAYVPDVFYLPACYVSSLDIKNLGNTRVLNINGYPRTIPEAYRFNITLKSLLPPSKNIHFHLETAKDMPTMGVIDTGTVSNRIGESWNDIIKQLGLDVDAAKTIFNNTVDGSIGSIFGPGTIFGSETPQ